MPPTVAEVIQYPEIIYEDEDILAVNKPAGLLVHSAPHMKRQGGEATLVKWLIKTYPQIATVGDDPELRPGIVHRLDKDTSGVMIIAKNQKSFEYLKALFMRHEMHKEYVAVAWGLFKEHKGIIDAPLGIVSGSTKRSTRSDKMAKPAITEYRVVRTFQMENDTFSVLSVLPKTGRTHQIRVHLASVGHPIVGDALYGRRKKISWASRLMLHAFAIQFKTPSGTELRLEAPVPQEFKIGTA